MTKRGDALSSQLVRFPVYNNKRTTKVDYFKVMGIKECTHQEHREIHGNIESFTILYT